MPKALWNLIKDIECDSGTLPLIHNADIAFFEKIRKTGTIEPQERPEYDNELLAFFFYGRPAYRPHIDLDTVNAKAFAPVCLVMNHELINDCWRIMPFDSGAYLSGKFSPPIHPTMDRGEFELAVHPTAPMKLIKMFFGSEREYFDGHPERTVDFDPWTNLVGDSYEKLIRQQVNTPLDDRVSAIEIQMNKNIEISFKTIAVILPKEYIDKPGIIDQIQSWRNPEIIPYDLPESFKPSAIIEAIRLRLRDYLADNKYFDQNEGKQE